MLKKSGKLAALCLAAMMAFSAAACSGGNSGGAAQTPTASATADQTAAATSAAPAPAQTEAAASASPQGNWQTDTSPITFDIYANASWFNCTWTTDQPDRVTTYITKKTGVTVNYILPTSDDGTKQATMVASGDVPDMVIASVYDAGFQDLIKAGLIQPLNKLADEYDKSFYDIVPPDQVGWFSSDDGNIYSYPNFSHAYSVAQEKLAAKDTDFLTGIAGNCVPLARKDIYEAIGSPDMSQPEGFLNALRQAKSKDFKALDGSSVSLVGFRDLTNLPNDVLSYLMQFTGQPPFGPGDTLQDPLTNTEVIRWLKTFRQAVQEGLITPDAFIDPQTTIRQKDANAQYFVSLMGRPDIRNDNTSLYKDSNGKETGVYYIPVDLFRNSQGGDPQIQCALLIDGWMNTMITTKCKDSARAIRFLNYIMGPEGQQDNFFGQEGVTFDMVNGTPTLKPFLTDGSLSGDDSFKKYSTQLQNWTWDNLDITYKWSADLTKSAPFDPSADIDKYAVKYMVIVPGEILVLETGTEEAIANSNIFNEWATTLPRLLNAASDTDFDGILNTFLQKRDSLGYAKVMAAQNAMHQANTAKLGK